MRYAAITSRAMWAAAFVWLTLAASAHAQGAVFVPRALRFLVVGEDTLHAALPIDPARVAALRRRISVSFDGVERAVALKEISRLSGLDFV